MKKICIIPARGGSKRLPQKNIKLLCGKPLIFHTLDAVLDSAVFDKVIFTSDEDNILSQVNKNYSTQAVTAIKRPPPLATDTSKVIDTVMHHYYEAVFDADKGVNNYEQVWLMLPTCPLRTAKDVQNANKLLTKKVHSVISITDVEFPPTLSIDKNENNLISSWHKSNPWENGNSRSQDHPIKYRPNGALYGIWSTQLETFKNFYTNNTVGYYMPRARSVDIDTEFDFKLAAEIAREST